MTFLYSTYSGEVTYENFYLSRRCGPAPSDDIWVSRVTVYIWIRYLGKSCNGIHLDSCQTYKCVMPHQTVTFTPLQTYKHTKTNTKLPRVQGPPHHEAATETYTPAVDEDTRDLCCLCKSSLFLHVCRCPKKWCLWRRLVV